MYKRPPKHVKRAQLIVLYSAMTIVVVVLVAILGMVVSNYRYNRFTGTFEQRGLVQFASIPSGATVEIDDKTLSSKTPTKYSVKPGVRRFAVWREGYETWILNTDIPAGSLVWLNYARLVPKDRPVEVIRSYEQVTATLASPTKRAIITQLDPASPTFRYVDIAHEMPKGHTITLPERLYKSNEEQAPEAEQPAIRYELLQWDESGRHVMLWQLIGNSRELIVLDTEAPEKSVNVSRELSLPIDQAEFSGRSGKILYVKTGGSIRKVDISGGTISRALVEHAESFSVYDTNTILYVSTPAETTGVRTAGVYRDGDEAPTVLRTAAHKDSVVAIASNDYYDVTYTAIAEGSTIRLYKGHYDNGLAGMELVTTLALSQSVEKIEFNESGSHVLMRAGTTFASYDIERDRLAQNVLEKGASKDLFWLDDAHLGLIVDGSLTMRDIDGSNVFGLNAATAVPGKSVTLSRNGTYMYSFNTKDNATSLQRIRMILR